MQYENIGQILAANGKARKRFLAVMTEISESEAATVPDGEKWSIKQVVEHLAMVDQGIARICGRLISKAKLAGTTSEGTFAISPEFWQHVKRIAGEKLEAPDQVQPKGDIPISESIGVLKENQKVFESMLQDLKSYDLSGPKFPHPYFGDLTAIEWLVIAGGHETRHTQQIERLLTTVRQ